jgi:hypothetical protein
MLTYNKIRAAGLLALWPLVGCGEGAQEARTVVRDSAGVSIVESAAVPLWSEAESWTLSNAPLADIGVVEGAPEYQLYGVGSSLRLSDGSIVVANGGTGELRWYDSTGRYLRSAGGQGDGPGEFQTLARVARLGPDSLIAYDAQGLRISVFAADGVFARSTALQAPNAVLEGVFADGSLLATNSDLRSRMFAHLQAGSDDLNEGVTRVAERAFHIAATGAVLDTLGEFLGSEGVINMRPSGTRVAMSFTFKPFGREAVFAVEPAAFYVGTQDRFQIDAYDPKGRLQSSVRHLVDSLPVTAADIDDFKRRELALLTEPNDIRRRRRELDELSYPETKPAFDAIHLDARGNLWVQEFSYARDEPSQWRVFDAEHQFLGTVATPPGFVIHDIGRDYVLGAWRDDMEVEHIRLYTLHKPAT